MKHLATTTIHFSHVDDLVTYYTVSVNWRNGSTIETLVPRHRIDLGWIEIFGLPPQHEWVVLGDIAPFTQSAQLNINNNEYVETVAFKPSPETHQHTIAISRAPKEGGHKEDFVWTEDYSDAPDRILNTGTFTSDTDSYVYSAEKSVMSSPAREQVLDRCTNTHKEWLTAIMDTHNDPDIVVCKKFSAKGASPTIFSAMFQPSELGVLLDDVAGTIIEVGFLNTEGSKLERQHGDWHKLIEISGQTFYIHEECGTFRREVVGGEEVDIKDTYTKRLYTI